MIQNIYKTRIKFLVIQFLIILILQLWIQDPVYKGSSELLKYISGWCVLSYAYLFFKELKNAPDFHPFLILELVTIQFVGFNGWMLANSMEAGEEVKFGIYPVNDYITEGAYYLLIEHFLVFFAFFIVDYYANKKNERYKRSIVIQVQNSNRNFFVLAVITYLTVWTFRLINELYPLASISSILASFTRIGQLLALTLLLFEIIKNPSNRIVLLIHWLIVIVEIKLVLGTGMKEDILINLLPFCFYLFLKFRSGNKIAMFSAIFMAICLFIFSVFVVFPYISIFRSMANERKVTWNQVQTEEVMDEYFNYIQDMKQYDGDEGVNRTTDYMLRRAGSIICNAWAIHHAEEHGPTLEFFEYAVSAMIPRFIWPDKPPVRIGAIVNSLSRGGTFADEQDEIGSVTLGFIGSCCFGLGLEVGFLIPLFVGFLFGLLWLYIKPNLATGIFSLWVFFFIVKMILKDMESIQDCGVTFTVFGIIYLICLKLLYRNQEL